MSAFPDSAPESYDFSSWDAAYFSYAGRLMSRIAEQKDTSSMRNAILRLYFQEGNDVPHE